MINRYYGGLDIYWYNKQRVASIKFRRKNRKNWGIEAFL